MDTGAETRRVPVGERAALVVSGQHRAQPRCWAPLRGARLGRAVEHDDPPLADPVGVPAHPTGPGGRTEIGEVAGRARNAIVVITQGRPQEPADLGGPAPGAAEAVAKLRERAVGVRVVSRREGGNRHGAPVRGPGRHRRPVAVDSALCESQRAMSPRPAPRFPPLVRPRERVRRSRGPDRRTPDRRAGTPPSAIRCSSTCLLVVHRAA